MDCPYRRRDHYRWFYSTDCWRDAQANKRIRSNFEMQRLGIPSWDIPSSDIPSWDIPSWDIPSLDTPSLDITYGEFPYYWRNARERRYSTDICYRGNWQTQTQHKAYNDYLKKSKTEILKNDKTKKYNTTKREESEETEMKPYVGYLKNSEMESQENYKTNIHVEDNKTKRYEKKTNHDLNNDSITHRDQTTTNFTETMLLKRKFL